MPTFSPIQSPPTTPPPPRPAGGEDPKPKAGPAAPPAGPVLPGDSLVLTPQGRARREGLLPADPDAALFDAVSFDDAWRKELAPALKRWPGRDESPVAIQQIRYADLLANGRETSLVFERDPGQLMPPMGLPHTPFTDPLTGQHRVALREARVRVSAGRYDLIMSVDGDGKLAFEKLFLDGKNVTRHAGDFVKGKIKEEPLVWGPVAVAAAAGAVALAHNQAAKTGKPIGFDAARFTVYRQDGLEVKAKLRGELTGDKSFVRAAGAEIGTTYHDGPLAATAGVRYGTRTKSVELVANMAYQVDKNSSFAAAASYDQHTKAYAVGVHYQSRF